INAIKTGICHQQAPVVNRDVMKVIHARLMQHATDGPCRGINAAKASMRTGDQVRSARSTQPRQPQESLAGSTKAGRWHPFQYDLGGLAFKIDGGDAAKSWIKRVAYRCQQLHRGSRSGLMRIRHALNCEPPCVT